MIQRDYYPLEMAADLLGCTVGDMIHLGASEKVEIYALTAGRPGAWAPTNSHLFDLVGGHRQPCIESMPPMVRISPAVLRIFEHNENATVNVAEEPVAGQDGVLFQWVMFSDCTGIEIPAMGLRLKDLTLVITAAELRNLQQPPEQLPAEINGDNHSAYISPALATLNRASREFWSTADPDDKHTHPGNNDVTKWLQDRGLSQTQARAGAAIIRPEWAAKGRPSEK